MEARVGHPWALRPLARRFPVTTFVVLALVVTWSVWVPRALVSQGYLDSEWPLTLGRFWTYGPAVAGVLAAWLAAGRAGLRELGSRLRRWRVGWRWYGVALLGPAAFWVVVVAINAWLGWSDQLGRPLIVQHGLAAAVPLLVYLALTDGLGEETGWRGYALPRQLERFAVVPASLLLGLVQAVWHLPLFWTEGTSLYGSSPWVLLLERPAASILFTWLFLHTQGSALLAILFHASWNLCTTSAGIAGSDHWGPTVVVLALTWLLAGIAASSWRRYPAGDASSGTIRSAEAVGHGAGRSGGHQ
jgi:membrane protease YdiL (CAAX protease family)